MDQFTNIRNQDPNSGQTQKKKKIYKPEKTRKREEQKI